MTRFLLENTTNAPATLRSLNMGRQESDALKTSLRTLNDLARQGSFFVESSPVAFRAPQVLKQGIAAAYMNVSHVCNLKCRYCFAGGGHYGRPTARLMSKATIRKTLDLLASGVVQGQSLNINLFGGEPLMNFDGIRFAVQYAKRAFAPDIKVTFGIATNATLLDRRRASFLEEHGIVPLLSIDPTAEDHNALRPFRNGKPSYERTRRNVVDFLRRYSVGRRALLRASFTGRTFNNMAGKVLALDALGDSPRIAYQPVHLAPDHPLSLDGVPEDHWIAQLEATAQVFWDRLVAERPLYHVDLIRSLRERLGVQPARSDFGCGLGRFLAFTPDGEIYPCHEVIELGGQFRLGSVHGSYDDQSRQRVLDRVAQRPEGCRECWMAAHCGIGCRGNAVRCYEDIDALQPSSCAWKEALFKTSAWLAARIRELPEERSQELLRLLYSKKRQGEDQEDG